MASTVSSIPSLAPAAPGAGNIEKTSTFFGYKFDRIDGNWYVDASRGDNIARFPYKGFYTLKLVQEIAVGVLAVFAVSLMMPRLCFVATPLDVAIIIEIICWAAFICLGIDAFNKNDPTILADKRNFLLDNRIVNAHTPLLTDYEKVRHFADDPNLSEKEYLYAHLAALEIHHFPGFTLTPADEELWNTIQNDLRRISPETMKSEFPEHVRTLQAITLRNLPSMTLSKTLAS